MKVLVCVDRSEASAKAVAVAAKTIGSQGSQVHWTLLHIAEFLPEFLLSDHPEAGQTSRTLAERWASNAKSAGEQQLHKAQAALEAAGIPAASIAQKLVLKDCLPESKKVAAALAIIAEMQAENYDLVVIGRRGAAELSVSMVGGVTEKVLREAHGRSVLVVD